LQATRPELAGHHPGFLADEINYLRDLGVTTLDDYLPLERTGRLTPLQDKPREAIWELLTTYRRQLSKDKLLDWHEVALTFYELSRTSPQRLGPGFDFIFIDEAQFFAKIWFPPVLAALKASGQLFLSADQTQGFLKRRQSWRDLGIDVIGRAHRLSRVYRSTRPIAEAARCFFESRTTASQPVLPEDLPDLMPAENLADLPDGEPVHLFAIASPGAARQKAAELVQRQLERTPHLAGQILVIEPEQVGLAAALRSHLKSPRVHDLQAGRRDPAPDSPLCLASSLHAATGLEATSVILLGLDSLLEKEDDPTLSPLETEERRAMHTRLIYVALTRAVCRLSIVTTRTDRWRELLGLPSPEA
jgi:superfamily I DNA/RNA helicase